MNLKGIIEKRGLRIKENSFVKGESVKLVIFLVRLMIYWCIISGNSLSKRIWFYWNHWIHMICKCNRELPNSTASIYYWFSSTRLCYSTCNMLDNTLWYQIRPALIIYIHSFFVLWKIYLPSSIILYCIWVKFIVWIK